MLELIVTGVLAVVKVGVGLIEVVAIAFDAIGMTRRKPARENRSADDTR